MQDLNKIQELAKAVIETEAEMVAALVHRIDENFAKACSMLLDCKGKVVVMGMGKSGHIGKKMAATFASTGTPAFFIHPGEAKHGDCGMITADDIVVALSNSGETEEVISIIPFIKLLNIPLISLTGNKDSALAKASNTHIDVSVSKEACPLGLAPTASTTAALAMGDALAISLLQTRGFTEKDFARSHPGGSLGKRLLLRVEEIMHKNKCMPLVNADAFLKTALVEITEKKLGMTAVINKNQKLAGVFTDGDLRRALDTNKDINITKVQDVMTEKPKIIKPDTLAEEALNIMEQNHITSLIVANEDNSPVGVVHLHDIIRQGIM